MFRKKAVRTKLGAFLDEFRARRGLNQNQMSRDMGIPAYTLNRFERREHGGLMLLERIVRHYAMGRRDVEEMLDAWVDDRGGSVRIPSASALAPYVIEALRRRKETDSG